MSETKILTVPEEMIGSKSQVDPTQNSSTQNIDRPKPVAPRVVDIVTDLKKPSLRTRLQI